MRILEPFIASPLAGAIGWTLLHSLWEGALISALLSSVLLATRSARIRYIAACVAMLAVVVGFGITLYRLMPEPAQTFPRFRPIVPFVPAVTALPPTNSGWSWLSILAAVAPWLAPFWLLGVLLLSLQRAMSFFAVRKARTRGVCFASEDWHAELARLAAQLGVSRPVHLLESCFAEVPMVLGHLRPVILMPLGLLATLPSEQVEAILLHELAHIRRCDYVINVFQRLVESLLFYHPAIWWMSKVMRSERENCCDDIVVSISQCANEYALALAALERNRLPRHQAAVAATGGTLVKRIHRLLYPKAPSGIWAPVAAALILVATAAVSLAAWPPKAAQQKLAFAGTRAQQTVAHSGQASAVPRNGSQPQSAPQLKPLSRAPISLRVTGESTMIYQTIASLAGLNVEFDPSFTSRRINVSLAGVTLEQALNAVSMMSGNKWTAVAADRFVVVAAATQARETGKLGSFYTYDGRTYSFAQGEANASGGSLQITQIEPYSKWLNEDVVYIITDEERDTFLHLKTDVERQQFITAFWERRNPTPGSPDNKFKDEHYRRIAYANQHFGTPSG